MREIKFRLWDGIKYHHVTLKDIFEDMDSYYSRMEYRGQYTGLKDKNGKEIYEGDFVKSWDGELKLVTFNTQLGSCGCCFDRFQGTGFIIDGDEVVEPLRPNPNYYYYDPETGAAVPIRNK